MVWFGKIFWLLVPHASLLVHVRRFLLVASWSPSFLLGLLVWLACGLFLDTLMVDGWNLCAGHSFVCVIITLNYYTSLICMLTLSISHYRFTLFIRLLILNIHMRIHYIYSEILPLLCAENQRCCSHQKFLKILFLSRNFWNNIYKNEFSLLCEFWSAPEFVSFFWRIPHKHCNNSEMI